MKKLFFFLLLAGFGFTASAQAPAPAGQQAPVTAEQRAKNQTEMLTKELNLTADQQQQFYALTLERFNRSIQTREKIMAAKNDTDREAIRQEMLKFNKETDQKIDALLNADQRTKLASIRKEQQDRAERERAQANRGGN